MKICPGTKLHVQRATIYYSRHASSERKSIKTVKRVISCQHGEWFIEIEGSPMRRFMLRKHENGDITLNSYQKPPIKYYVYEIE